MFDDKLAERLSDAVSTAFFGDLVELIIREVEFVASDTSVGPETLSWPILRRYTKFRKMKIQIEKGTYSDAALLEGYPPR